MEEKLLPAGIIVAEDEAIVAFDVCLRLKSMGYRIAAMVATGEDSIAAARTYKPDLILMDIGLKGMDGITAGTIINRELGTPIFFMSAYADDATLKRAAELSPDGYLSKPFSDHDLKALVNHALSLRSTIAD
jgi:CheY-like chemotaxis protein